ncbi:glycosyltransferase family 2 protein [bacterium]|nr:glycosyltransferase family 2 protein [bacterium]
MDLSVVVPVFNEEDSLAELVRQISVVCEEQKISFEIIFVDDGSTDGSFALLEELHQKDKRIRVIQFRRNFGKAEALSAGFSVVRGDRVLTLDADLQDDPAEIPFLIRVLDEGLDLVSGWKKTRKDPLSKRIPSKIWNFMTSVMTGIKLHDFNCGIKMYRREVVESVHIYGELHRYIPALVSWEGFSVGEMPVNHRPRLFGRSKYGASRFFKGFLDLITIMFLSRYTRRPLHLFGMWGLVFGSIGAVITVTLMVLRIIKTIYLSNRPLLFIGVLFILLGMQFFSIGLLGEMITRSHSKNRNYSIRRFLGE